MPRRPEQPRVLTDRLSRILSPAAGDRRALARITAEILTGNYLPQKHKSARRVVHALPVIIVYRPVCFILPYFPCNRKIIS